MPLQYTEADLEDDLRAQREIGVLPNDDCRRGHWRVTGTLGVLRAAAERGLVNVAELVARLKPTTF